MKILAHSRNSQTFVCNNNYMIVVVADAKLHFDSPLFHGS